MWVVAGQPRGMGTGPECHCGASVLSLAEGGLACWVHCPFSPLECARAVLHWRGEDAFEAS